MAENASERSESSKEATSAVTKEASRLSPMLTVLISVGTALLTALLAPYLLERAKDSEAARQREKERQDRIVGTQFEIIEHFNETFWRYRQAAGFLMFDFVHGQSEDLLHRHLKEFEDISSEANREMPTEAFRARMYFQSVYVNNLLFTIWANIFTGVDDHISKQLLLDNSAPQVNNPASKKAWSDISQEINQSMISSEESLNEVFKLIGQTGIDQKMSPKRKLELFRLPSR